MNTKFLFISDLKGSPLWIDNLDAEDVDFNPFYYDANQYPDKYCKNLVDKEERIKKIITNCIIKPNLVSLNHKKKIMQLDSYLKSTCGDIAEFNSIYQNKRESTEMCLNAVVIKSHLYNKGIHTDVISSFTNIENYRMFNNYDQYTAVGISTTFIIDWENLIDIAKQLKELNPNKPIIVGGPLVYLLRDVSDQNKKNIFKKLSKYVDYMILSQNGEETLSKLILALKENRNIDKISNLIILKNNEYFYTGFRIEKANLKTELLNWNNMSISNKINTVPVETSRGCPFACNFCSYPKFQKYTEKPLELLRKELIQIKHNKNIKYISFVDGSLNGNSKRVKEICKMMIRDEIGKNWHFMGNVKGVDEEQAKLMSESGCSIANIGVESGSLLIRKLMNKPIESDKDINNAFNCFNKHNIITRGYFFVGYPGENDKSIKDTISLINSVNMDLFRMTLFRPRLNSKVYIDRKKTKLVGRGYLWQHYSCDSLKASEYIPEIIKNVKPNYDPARGVYEVMMRGIDKEVAMKLNKAKNLMNKDVLNNKIIDESKIKNKFVNILKSGKVKINEN